MWHTPDVVIQQEARALAHVGIVVNGCRKRIGRAPHDEPSVERAEEDALATLSASARASVGGLVHWLAVEQNTGANTVQPLAPAIEQVERRHELTDIE